MLIENLVLIGIETRRSHFCRHRNAHCVAHALAEWPGRAFHSGSFAKLRVARRLGMQLPEPFYFRHGQVVAAHVQPRVKEHAAVPAREDEDIAIDPARLVRAVFQGMAEEYCAHFGATEGKTKMTGLRSLHGVHAQTACFIGRPRENFDI
jgi:hypothetical protein